MADYWPEMCSELGCDITGITLVAFATNEKRAPMKKLEAMLAAARKSPTAFEHAAS